MTFIGIAIFQVELFEFPGVIMNEEINTNCTYSIKSYLTFNDCTYTFLPN